jgi:hypothetical protein
MVNDGFVFREVLDFRWNELGAEGEDIQIRLVAFIFLKFQISKITVNA